MDEKKVKLEKDSKNTECLQCEAKFKRPSLLKLHVKTVHDKIRYQCKKCDKNYKYRHHLRAHADAEHNGSYEWEETKNNFMEEKNERKPIKCKECSSAFNTKTGLNIHMKTKHKNVSLHKCQFPKHQQLRHM